MTRVVAVLATMVVLLLGIPATGIAQDGPAQVRFELTQLSPRLVADPDDTVVRVTGRVVNTGERPINDLAVRLQRDDRVRTDDGVAAGLRGELAAHHLTPLTPLTDSLEPGDEVSVELTVPVTGGWGSLQIAEPGVYPLLLNVSGVPEDGAEGELASIPLLLPVLRMPGGPPAPPASPGPPKRPAPLTMLWPITAEPALLPTVPGEPTTVTHPDAIAQQLTPGGRLDGLVTALAQGLPPGSPLADAVCVAVEPDLLATVEAMAQGYRVSSADSPLDPTRATIPGGASEVAANWLDRLRRNVQGRCVMSLPYADADLVALNRAGLDGLAGMAIASGHQMTERILGVRPVSGLSWPAGGVVDEPTASMLAQSGRGTMVLQPVGLASPPAAGAHAQLTVPAGGSAITADPLLTDALAHTGPGPLGAQGALGALVYRAMTRTQPQGQTQFQAPRPMVLTPPRVWRATGPEATQLLQTAGRLVAEGLLEPQSLVELRNSPPAAPAVPLHYPPEAGARELPPPLLDDVGRALGVLDELQAASARDAAVNLPPPQLFDPLRFALLRGVSAAWRDDHAAAAAAVNAATGRVNDLRSQVRILPPPGPYTLASSDAPLLVTVANELPVVMRVRLVIDGTPGLRTGETGLAEIPAHTNRQLVIPAEVERTGQFTVEARMTTPGGMPLGQPTALQLRSTAVGTVTIALTAGAAGVLVLLIVRRVIRRIRTSRAQRTTG